MKIQNAPFRALLLILAIAFLIFNLAGYAYPQDAEWDVFSTSYCTVFYQKGVELKTVSRRISLGFSDFFNPRKFKRDPGASIEDIVSGKFDAIFSKVEEVLDMYPSRIHVTINVYKTKAELDPVYEGFFNEPNEAISFYIYKTNTIYTTERDITEGVIAHEMAHCIIDHYFVILPPRKIQEMLAVYADVHLKD